ncbi:MAG: ABC transporter substrate-binding protein, partial [Kiloniellaceae bacterium]
LARPFVAGSRTLRLGRHPVGDVGDLRRPKDKPAVALGAAAGPIRRLVPWSIGLMVLAAGYSDIAPARAKIEVYEAPKANPGAEPRETPVLRQKIAKGELPPIAERLPDRPYVVPSRPHRTLGRPGGDLRMLVSRAKDTRLLVVYGYARLIGYDEDLRLVPDILDRLEVEDGRIFTLHLRKGHKWSDGHPFTTEDFRYYWEDVANHETLSPVGPPALLLVDKQPPQVEILDAATVRYSWPRPNPFFLPALAGARPTFIYRPAHYLKQFHAKYADPKRLAAAVAEAGVRNWAVLHNRRDNQYRFDNPDLPTLQPWVNTVAPPSTRYIAVRNPYYHRIDEAGQQLPYADRVILNVVGGALIPAKAGAGEADLQSRGLSFTDYTFLKSNEKRSNYKVRLWRTVRGSQFALYPNLNVNDPVWKKLVRDVRFRRALSLAIDRHEVNQAVYFGLTLEGNNGILPDSPLYKPHYREAWADFDLAKANALLDEIGLNARDRNGIRLLPDGRPLAVIVESAGENTDEVDVLELIHDTWLKAGIKLYTKPSQREVLRNRVFTGETLIAIWFGYENGIPTSEMSPEEFAPVHQQSFHWPKWGQYLETGGRSGEPIDMALPKELMRLYRDWTRATDSAERTRIWERILEIHADQVYTIGLVAQVPQPVVVARDLRNVPESGIYNWEPGAQFGIYRPESFWFDR